MAGNVFRFDPPPPPPPLHAPIPAQGDQPPRRTQAMLMACVLASWPTGLEYQPIQRIRLAPIPAQGDQPPRRTQAGLYAGLIAWLPPDPQPAQRPLTVAPLTLTYGDQPPRRTQAGLYAVLQTWLPPDPQPVQRIRLAPIPAQGDQPPRRTQAGLYAVLQTWLPPDPQPVQRPLTVAPLTLTYGDQPPRQHPADLYATLQTWLPPDPQPVQRPLTVAPLTLTYGQQPPRHTIDLVSTRIAWLPPDPRPAQRPLTVAPLTLTYGDQPPRRTQAGLYAVLQTWLPPDPQPAQRPPAMIPPTPSSLLTNLAGYWPLDEASGNALDSLSLNDLADNNTVGAAAGKVNGARSFAAASLQYFSHASNSTFQTGDVDFTLTAWVKLSSKPGTMEIVGKRGGGAGSLEYYLRYDGVGDRFNFEVSPNGSTPVTNVVANTLGSPVVGVWYFVACWHDSVNNQLGISVNAGAADTTSFSSGVFAGTSAFKIGATADSGTNEYWDGLIDEVGFWKNRVLSASDLSTLYNGDAGLAYPFSGSPAAGPPSFSANLVSTQIAWLSPDPQPAQRIRLAPIPAQGDQPPRRTQAGLYAGLIAWLPPDPQPVQRPLTLAPLTLTYGDQPPRFSTVGLCATLRAWLPPDPQPVQRPLTLAPLTLTYGDQPPLRSGASGFYAILAAWLPPDQAVFYPAKVVQPSPAADVPPSLQARLLVRLALAWLPDPQPVQRPLTLAPLTLTYGDQPPRRTIDLVSTRIAWLPPDPQPAQRPLTVAPLTLTYGDQPPRRAPVVPRGVLFSWEAALWHYCPSVETFVSGAPAKTTKRLRPTKGSLDVVLPLVAGSLDVTLSATKGSLDTVLPLAYGRSDVSAIENRGCEYGEDVTVPWTLVTGEDITAMTLEAQLLDDEGGTVLGSASITKLTTTQAEFRFASAETAHDTITHWRVRRTDVGSRAVLTKGRWTIGGEHAV